MLRSFLVLAAMVMLAVPAQAGVLGNLLTFNGVQDQINNTAPSLVSIIDTNSNGGLDIGEVAFGFVASQQIQNDGGSTLTPDNVIVTMFAAEVGSVDATTGVFSLIAPTDSSQTLHGLLQSASNGFAAQFDTTDLQDDVVAMVISSKGNVNTGDLTGLNGPTSTNWLSSVFNTDDYAFEALLDLNDGGFFDLIGQGSPSPPPIFEGEQTGGFNVAKHIFGSTIEFLPVMARRLPASPATFTPVDVALSRLSFESADPSAPQDYSDRGWALVGNASTLTVNAVPEPGTVVAFLAIGFVGARVAGRRSKRR